MLKQTRIYRLEFDLDGRSECIDFSNRDDADSAFFKAVKNKPYSASITQISLDGLRPYAFHRLREFGDCPPKPQI